MRIHALFRSSALLSAALLLSACGEAPAPEPDSPQVAGGGSDIERGRYLVTIGGCNDCHTDGYMAVDGNMPESEWLLGSAVGWRGPWGTTYPPNLRLRLSEYTEDQFVEVLRTRTALPPMPWMNVNRMAEADARAIYRFVASLGPAGEHMPTPVPPDVEPETPYLSMEPVLPGS